MFQFTGYNFLTLFYSDEDDCRLWQPGFPIRKSPDQSVFAAPRSLSQLTTSFIASYRQGIHLLPVTVCNCRFLTLKDKYSSRVVLFYYSLFLWRWTVKEQKLFCFLSIFSNHSIFYQWWALVDSNHRPPRYQHDALTNWAKGPWRRFETWGLRSKYEFQTWVLDCYWWSQTESNRRHPACKAGALPTELWPRLKVTKYTVKERKLIHSSKTYFIRLIGFTIKFIVLRKEARFDLRYQDYHLKLNCFKRRL